MRETGRNTVFCKHSGFRPSSCEYCRAVIEMARTKLIDPEQRIPKGAKQLTDG